MIAYKNPSGQNYVETITLKVLENLKIKTQKGEVQGKTVKLVVPAGGVSWVALEFKDMSNTASKYSMSYV